MKIFIIGGNVESGTSCPKASPTLASTCLRIAAAMRPSDIELIACSLFPDSFDRQIIDALQNHWPDSELRVSLFYPNEKQIAEDVEMASHDGTKLKIIPFPQPPSPDESAEAKRNAWLTCQLLALDQCHAVVMLGGRSGGSAQMLAAIAQSRGKPILPIPTIGGIAEDCFVRWQYELRDRLGSDIDTIRTLDDSLSIPDLLTKLTTIKRGFFGGTNDSRRVFFISYARKRPMEADYIEALLRRRNQTVIRDEHEFGAGDDVMESIKSGIYRSNVFIAAWCAEYAASPHCFDELDMALSRKESGKCEVWIIRLDKTRIVPPRAREILYRDADKREDIDGILLQWLGK